MAEVERPDIQALLKTVIVRKRAEMLGRAVDEQIITPTQAEALLALWNENLDEEMES
jgi:hypothetical protein